MIRYPFNQVHSHRGVILVSVCFFALSALYGVINPPFESHDEDQHFLFIKELSDHHLLPVRQITTMLDETHQAPLYHALAALATFYIDTGDVARALRPNPAGLRVAEPALADNRNRLLHGPWEEFPWRGTVLAAHIARLLSAVFGALTVVFAYLTARELAPERREVAILAAVAIAFNVQFMYISSAVSNDVLIASLSAAALVPLLRMIRLGVTTRRAVIAGVLIGLAALAKASGAMLLPVALLALVLAAIKTREWASTARRALWLFLPAIALSGWWYVRNQLLYQDWSALRMVYLSGAQRPTMLSIREALPLFDSVQRSFYVPWLWTHFRVPEEAYVAGEVILGLGALGTLIAMAGLLWRLWKVSGSEASRARRFGHAVTSNGTLMQAIILLFWTALVAAALLRYMQESVTSESGRFMFPAIVAIYALLAWGWCSLVPRRVAGVLPVALAVPGLLWSLAYPWLYLVPAYAPPTLLRQDQLSAIPQRVDAHIEGAIALLGYDHPISKASPGDTVDVSVYWQSLAPTDEDYTVFVHLVQIGGGAVVAQRDTYTGLGNFPTSAWKPGQAFRDTYRVKLPESLPVPQVLDVEIGMFLGESEENVPFSFADGRAPADALALGQVKLLGRQQADRTGQTPVDAIFGQTAELVGVTLNQSMVEGQDRLPVTLYWRQLQPMTDDYTIFVHVFDKDDKRVAQVDERPVHGVYPTTYWEPGQVVPDQHHLPVARLDPGVYRILVGMYDAHGGPRLTVTSTSPVVDGNAVVVGQFVVEPR